MAFDRRSFIASHTGPEYSVTAPLPESFVSSNARLFSAINAKNLEDAASALGVHKGFFAKLRNAFTIAADIEARNDQGFTPLQCACMGGNLAIVRLLLDNKAKLDSLTPQIGTALSLAVINGHGAVAAELLARGFDMKSPAIPAHANALCQAIMHDKEDIALQLLDAGADPAQEGLEKSNALTIAAQRGSVKVLAALLDGSRMDVNHKDAANLDALFRAIKADKIDAVAFLLDRGANLCGSGKLGPPLLSAVRQGRIEIARMLVSRGADPHEMDTPDIIDGTQWSPIKLASVMFNMPEMYEMLARADEIRADYVAAENVKTEAEKQKIHDAVSHGIPEKITRVAPIRFKK